MVRISEHFADYAAYHEGRGNRLCHLIGIPCLGVGIVGLLSRIPSGPDAGLMTVALFAGIYVAVEWRLGILFALACPPVWLLGLVLPWQVLVMLVFAGLALPIAGHVLLEKHGPRSLAEGATGAFLAPLWFLNLFARIVPPGRR